MTFRFRRKETTTAGVHRIIRDLTAAFVSLLADQGNDVVNRVHDARRHIKRLRSVLRLILPSTDRKKACELEEQLRAASKRLARSRDAEVCVATFDLVTQSHSTPTIDGIRVLLRELSDRAHRASTTPAQLGAIATMIRESGHRVAELPLAAEDWDLLHPALDKSYRAARKMRKILNSKADNSEYHAWRKKTKRLHYQVELLWSCLNKSQRQIVKKLNKLGDCLGEFHDLDILEACFRDLAAHGIAQHDCRAAHKLSEQRRKELKKRISKISKGAFTERPKKFLRDLHTAWKRSRKKLAN